MASGFKKSHCRCFTLLQDGKMNKYYIIYYDNENLNFNYIYPNKDKVTGMAKIDS